MKNLPSSDMQAVLYERRGPLAWITLNRPERLNAMNGALVAGLSGALQAAEADAQVRVVILHGAGRAFCSGDDLKDIDAQTGSEAQARAWIESIQQVTRQIMGSGRIMIAAVHGWCVGGALEWAINCDFRLFADDARWFFPEVGYGLFVTGGVTALLTKQIGPQATKALMILGEKHDAQAALRYGIAWQLLPRETLLAEAERLGLAIADKPEATVRQIKRAINEGLHGSLEDALALETEVTVRAFRSPEQWALGESFAKGRA